MSLIVDLVDSIVFIKTGYHLDDLSDEDFRINFDNGLYACNMARIVINNNHYLL